MMIYWFAISLVAYFFLHSLLAAEAVKKWLKSIIPANLYRLVYNLFALLFLWPPVIIYLLLDQHFLIKASPWFSGMGIVLLLTGAAWCWKAMGGYHLGEFTGVYQWKYGKEPAHTRLQVDGLNQYVRHPLYFGTLLIGWGIFLLVPTDALLVTALIMTAYIFIGSLLEERKLTQQFGEAYRLYRQEVPMLLPFGWWRRKNG